MAVAIRATSKLVSASAATSHSLPAPSGLQDGDYVLVVITTASGATVNSVPSGFGSALYAGVAGRCQVYGKFASGEPSSWSWGISASQQVVIHCFALTGVDVTTPFSASGGSSITPTGSGPFNVVVPAISPGDADTFLIGAVGQRTAQTFTKPASMTLNSTDANGSGTPCTQISAYEQLSASGSTGTRTFTSTSTQGCTGWLGAFKPAPVAAAADYPLMVGYP